MLGPPIELGLLLRVPVSRVLCEKWGSAKANPSRDSLARIDAYAPITNRLLADGKIGSKREIAC